MTLAEQYSDLLGTVNYDSGENLDKLRAFEKQNRLTDGYCVAGGWFCISYIFKDASIAGVSFLESSKDKFFEYHTNYIYD